MTLRQRILATIRAYGPLPVTALQGYLSPGIERETVYGILVELEAAGAARIRHECPSLGARQWEAA